MENETRIDGPPIFPTPYSPEEIIGRDNLGIFKEHLAICFKENNGDFPDKSLNRKFDQETRKAVAKVLAELRDNGYFPIDVNEDGRIVWRIMTKSGSQIEQEKYLTEYEGKSLDELREMARGGYRVMRDRQDVEPVKRWQMDAEGDADTGGEEARTERMREVVS